MQEYPLNQWFSTLYVWRIAKKNIKQFGDNYNSGFCDQKIRTWDQRVGRDPAVEKHFFQRSKTVILNPGAAAHQGTMKRSKYYIFSTFAHIPYETYQ